MQITFQIEIFKVICLYVCFNYSLRSHSISIPKQRESLVISNLYSLLTSNDMVNIYMSIYIYEFRNHMSIILNSFYIITKYLNYLISSLNLT